MFRIALRATSDFARACRSLIHRLHRPRSPMRFSVRGL